MSEPSGLADRMIRAHLLGSIDIRAGDRLLSPGSWPRRQARSILLMLLGTPGHRVTRDYVIEALWPELDPERQLNAVYKAIHALRRTLEPGLVRGRSSAYIDTSNEWVSLRSQPGVLVDVDLFEAHVLAAERAGDPRDRLRAALNLYRGPFLADEPYSDWPAPRREALESMRVHATLRLAELDRAGDQPLASIGHLEALLTDQPALESAHRAIIEGLMASGQRELALQQIERCRRAVYREFGHALAPETEALEARANRRVSAARREKELAAPRLPLRIPGVPTATIGRRAEIATVRDLLIDPNGPRLVTIVGTGGTGKTRLAIEAARAAAPSLPDGVTFIDLTAIRETSLLPAALVKALNIQVQDGNSFRERIRETLEQSPHHLLVLDNLEHLPGIERELANLLSDLPTLRMLATSREPTRIRAEWLVRLEPFETPAPAAHIDPQRLRENDAVALFLQCSMAWGASRGDAGDSLTDVTMLVRKLDGLPLAIELAAARSSEMTPASMLAQLGNRFELLNDGPRDLPERHRTLESTIDWSYALLPPEEQRLFRGLAVFVNGIEVDSLQTLFGIDAIARVTWLAEKSLVRWVRRDGARRVELLESIRSYAEHRLIEMGELDRGRREHARYFADLVARADEYSAKRGSTQIGWMRRLAREHDNLHFALANSLETSDAPTALALTSGMGFYCLMHHAPEDVRSWIDGALAFDPAIDSEAAGWTAIWGAEFSWRAGDSEAAMAFIERARSIWTAREFRNGLAWADGALAGWLARNGRYDEAIAIHRANAPGFRAVNDYEGAVSSLTGIAWSLRRLGRHTEAIDSLDEALAAAREAENFVLQSYVLPQLATALIDLNQFERAGALATEGERIARLIDDQRALPWLIAVQARVALHENNALVARTQGDAAFAGFQSIGDRRNAWWGALTGLTIRTQLGDLDDAISFAGEAIRTLEHSDDPSAPLRLHAELTALQGQLGMEVAEGHLPPAAIECVIDAIGKQLVQRAAVPAT